MTTLVIPKSVGYVSCNFSSKTFPNYTSFRADMSTSEFMNIKIDSVYSGLGKYDEPVDLYLKDILQSLVTIPGEVYSIGYNLIGFNINELTLREGVANIYGLQNCASLKQLNLPKSLTDISDFGLSNNANLTDVYYAGTVSDWANVKLGNRWNYNSSFTVIHCTDGDVDLTKKGGLVIPEGVTVLEQDMLKDDMKILYIPSTLTESNVTIAKDKTYTYYRELHCTMDLEQFLNVKVSSYSSSLAGYYGNAVDLYLKEEKQDNIEISSKFGITTLGYQLCGVGVKKIYIDEGVEAILGLEYLTNLTSISLPKTLKTIGDYGLAKNTALTDVYYRGTKAEWYKISLGNNYKQICPFEVIHCADGDLSLTVEGPVIEIPDGLTTLTLSNIATDLETLIIPNSLVSTTARINKQTYTLYNRLETTKSLEEFLAIDTNNDYRNAIGGYGQSLSLGKGQLTDLVINGELQEGIVVPGTVEDAGNNLSSLSITYLAFEEGVKTIGCAGYCENLMSITLPSTLTSIGERGFYGCTSLSELIYNGTMKQWANISLSSRWKTGTQLTVVTCTDGEVTL